MSAVAEVDALIAEGLRFGASDIHLETQKDGLCVRLRVDGLLVPYRTFEPNIGLQIIARIKVLANSDVAEKRLPQDGKFSIQTPKGEIDLRVSTFPAHYGEKLVIRILDRFAYLLDLEHIGFSHAVYERFTHVLNRMHGFILVTGPTGSGKTTTLYAALQKIISTEKNIMTLENPIEYNMQGVIQGQVHPEIGFTFAKGLRALVRQDPDTLMVGEIRDKETAEIAIQAALTGHLLLSSLHTPDAPGAVLRLLDMGIPAFLLNAAITAVLAQRLVRKLCIDCREQRDLHEHEKELLGKYALPMVSVFYSRGCAACHFLGHKGRIGVFELLTMSGALRRLIAATPSVDDVYAQACADGMQPLIVDAAAKVSAGIIDFKELLRICV